MWLFHCLPCSLNWFCEREWAFCYAVDCAVCSLNKTNSILLFLLFAVQRRRRITREPRMFTEKWVGLHSFVAILLIKSKIHFQHTFYLLSAFCGWHPNHLVPAIVSKMMCQRFSDRHCFPRPNYPLAYSPNCIYSSFSNLCHAIEWDCVQFMVAFYLAEC